MESKYEVTAETVNSLKGQLVLPKFQRGYVWSEKKKIELIKSLHKGYPFGALMTHPKEENGQKKDRLLDGQQRWSTILDYTKKKAHYYKKVEPNEYKKALDELNQWLKIDSELITEEDFDNVISGNEDRADWVEEQKEKHEFQEGIDNKKVREYIKKIQEKIDSYLNIDSIKIPVIRYTGSDTNIAEVFENLNKGGVQLTKFEIFAAAWSDNTEIQLENTEFQNELLNAVKKFYIRKRENAEKFDFELDEFSEDDLTKDRRINLYELGVALGEFIVKRLPALVSDTEKSINEIGFGVLGIAGNMDPKNLNELNGSLDIIASNIEEILQKADRISNKLQVIFDKLLSQNSKKDNQNQYHTGLTTTYKTLSYFAAMWNLEEGSIEETKTIQNIPAYYVYDAVSGNWGNAGDSRLLTYYTNFNNDIKRNYLKEIDKVTFKDDFYSWIENENGQARRFSASTKALETIHANLTYLADSINYSEALEFEHIYPKARIQKIDKGKQVLLGRIGDSMYLPKGLNQKKKTNTLYEYDNGNDYSDLIKESSYPSEADFRYVFKKLASKDFDAINDRIIKRSRIVADRIIDKLLNSIF